MSTYYVKNMSQFNQQFRAAGAKFMLRPDQVTSMTQAEFEDHPTQFLLARGILKQMDDESGLSGIVEQAEAAQAKANEHKLEVNKAGEDTVKQVMMTQCAATKKNGERCGNNVSVKMSEYDENVPYFCGTHRNEKADEYEKADGTWRKRLVVEPAPEPEPVAEPSVEEEPVEAITDDEIAEALAEVMEEE